MATSTLLVALAALCSAPSSAASPDEARDIAAFKRAFGAGRPTAASLEEKRQTLAAMAAHDSAKVVRALVVGYTILEREAAALEEKRRPLLEQLGGKKLLPFRLELKPIRALQGTIIERLLAARDPDAVRSQVKLLLKRRSGLPFSVRAVFAATATRLSDQDRRLVLDAKGKRRPVQDIALLLDAIGSLEKRGADAGPWVVRMLAHKDPLVRERAAHALSRLRWPGSLQPLVARLAVEDGRMRARLGRTLEQLTGMKLGTSGAAWKRWLDQEGGPFMNGEKPLGGHESTVTAEAAGGYYFGIPQDGRSILYVYDNSQSMKQKLHQETDKDGNPVTRQARARKELL
ncbi:MAG: hypothetical protein CMJ83_11790, partial [Planctomycetes bacterium]|nr:hypothetical protein [Planctomycetota bacterium]